MKVIKSFKDGKIKKINPDFFTGKPELSEISPLLNLKESKMYHVKFPKGARTKLHSHTGSQLLIVTRGEGSLESFKKIGNGKSKFKIKKIKRTKLTSGSIAYIPPKVLHTHGSIKRNQLFSHIAINFFPSKNIEPETKWYESDFQNLVTNQI